MCVVDPPKGTLHNQGACFDFHFDSGAECSLIKESFAAKFSGKRIQKTVSLTGIGQSSIFSTQQILCNVDIDGYNLELVLHVLPDVYMRSDIMLGREILNQGFVVNISASKFSITKDLTVNSFDVSSSSPVVNNFENIDTDIPSELKCDLLKVLNDFSEYFIMCNLCA